MIGKICSVLLPYYDMVKKANAFKKRPALIISGLRNDDYTILPISTISRRDNLDAEYDIAIDVQRYPNLGLHRNCYVRTHKQTIAHRGMIAGAIGDMKTDYPDLYRDVMDHLSNFNKELYDSAFD